MEIKTRKIAPEELTDFIKERNDGALYLVKAMQGHSPTFSEIIIGPAFEEPPYSTIPIHALKKKFLAKIKIGEVGRLVNASYENSAIKYLVVNWRNAIQVYYRNPAQIAPREKHSVNHIMLEDMFEIIKKSARD